MTLDEDDDWEEEGLWQFYYRLGFFQRKEVPTVHCCKNHFDALTWNFDKNFFHKHNCMMPGSHTGRAGSKCKPSAGRATNVQQSYDFLTYLGKLVPLGAFICDTDRKKADAKVKEQKQLQSEQVQEQMMDVDVDDAIDDETKDKSYSLNQNDPALDLLNQLLKLHGQKVKCHKIIYKRQSLQSIIFRQLKASWYIHLKAWKDLERMKFAMRWQNHSMPLCIPYQMFQRMTLTSTGTSLNVKFFPDDI